MVASQLLRRPAVNVGGSSPFYLLSALLMAVGCYTVSHTLDLHAGGVRGLLGLIAVLNLYEGLLIGLGVYLMRSHRLARDGALLLILEAVFLLDAAYLNTELLSARPPGAAGLAGAVLALMAVKVCIVARALGFRVRLGDAAAIAAGLVGLVTLPTILASVSNSREVSGADLYVGWWTAAVIMGLHGAWTAMCRGEQSQGQVRRVVCTAYVIAMYVSLVGHLLALGWVYHVQFRLAFVAPVVLAAVPWVGLHRRLFAMDMALPAAAVLLSVSVPHALQHDVGGVQISSLRLVLWATGACYGWLAVVRRSWVFVPAIPAVLLLSLLGHDASSISTHSAQGWAFIWKVLRNYFPRGGQFWGGLAIAWAFILLVVGAARSFRTARRGATVPAT